MKLGMKFEQFVDICVIPRHYSLTSDFQAYSWFFVSLLQEYFRDSGNSEFVRGEMMLPKPETLTRTRIREHLRRVYCMPAPFSVRAPRHSSKYG